jgi:DNA polymerase-3 subunit alpha
MGKWIPLHVHSEYSALDGAIKIKPYVKWAAAAGHEALAVTDHGVMCGHVDLDKATSGSGLKPIYGCEMYTSSLLDGSKVTPLPGDRIYHLLVLARDAQGYRNLMKLMTAAHRNLHRKALVTRDMLEEHAGGLVLSTACIEGELPRLLEAGNDRGARFFVDTLRSIAGPGNAFVELMDTGDKDQAQIQSNQRLNALAHAMGVPTIITTDSHYFAQDRPWHDALLAAQTKKTLDDPNRLSLAGYDLSLRTADAMEARWRSVYPEALDNTALLADSIGRFPIAPETFQMPRVNMGVSLEELSRRGLDALVERYYLHGTSGDYHRQLDYELGVIRQMGFENYFLMVYDLVNWAKGQGIMVGPGRGSAAGSVLAWSLGITSIDPLRYGLLFERFLNPERISMPDIDLDFEDERRGEVVSYLHQRYGENAVAPIINYSRPEWKQALKDAARVLGFSAEWANRFSKTVDPTLATAAETFGDNMEALQEKIVTDGITEHLGDEPVRKTVELAGHMRGLLRHYGKHAAGMVVAPGDITDFTPLYNLKGDLVTQFDMNGIDHLKMVKMDLLGLSTLTQIKRTVELARTFDPETPSMEDLVDLLNRHGMTAEMDKGIPAHDRTDPILSKISRDSITSTLSILERGETTGVFQLASSGMRKLLTGLRPRNIDDLSALVALYRPGPLNSGMTRDFVRKRQALSGKGGRRKGNESDAQQSPFPESVAPAIEKITSDTSGLIVYQEHVMRVAREIAGYSLGQADMLRRAMGKKKAEVMAAEKSRFVQMAGVKGFPEQDAAEVFDKLEYFSGYGFNKSHSTAYAFLAFITGWYRANRAPAFWAALLEETALTKKQEELAPFLREASRYMRIIPPVLSPGERPEDASTAVVMDDASSRLLRQLEEPGSGAMGNIWKIRGIWGVRLGLEFVRGWSHKKLEAIQNVPLGTMKTMTDLFRYLVTDPAGCETSAGSMGSLFLSGVLDPILRETAKGFGLDTQPYLTRLALIELNAEAPDPGLIQDMLNACRPFTRKDMADGRFPFEVRTTNGVFGSWLDYVCEGVRKKQVAKRSPWLSASVEDYTTRCFVPVVEALVRQGEILGRRLQEDFPARITARQSLYVTETESLGESVSVPSWLLAAEMADCRFALYGDEMSVLADMARDPECATDDLVMSATGKGIWVLGYLNGLYTGKDGNSKVILGGRWGEGSQPSFVSVTPRQAETLGSEILYRRGAPVFIKASLSPRYPGRYDRGLDWKMDEGTVSWVFPGVAQFGGEGTKSPLILPQDGRFFVRLPMDAEAGSVRTGLLRYLEGNAKKYHSNDFSGARILSLPVSWDMPESHPIQTPCQDRER